VFFAARLFGALLLGKATRLGDAVDEIFSRLLPVCLRFHQMDGSTRHDGRYRMLIDELRVTVAAQENAKVVEPGHDALKFDTVDEENRKGRFALANMIEKRVLKVLSAICGHRSCLFF
jgi:hypothetical protein